MREQKTCARSSREARGWGSLHNFPTTGPKCAALNGVGALALGVADTFRNLVELQVGIV